MLDVSKGSVLDGFEKLLGSVMIPALQKQEVSRFVRVVLWVYTVADAKL